jgi:hypothetical protein
MARVFLLLVVCGLLSCGYRPAAGRLAPTVSEDLRFAPFRVRNDTPELALSHVVLESARGELSRRRLLAEQGEIAGNNVELDLAIRRISELPASYSPAGEIIEYYGELQVYYRVYDMDPTAPVLATGLERLPYRYDFRPNPQDIRLYRYSAIARSVRDWIPELTWRAAAGIRLRETRAAAATTEVTP